MFKIEIHEATCICHLFTIVSQCRSDVGLLWKLDGNTGSIQVGGVVHVAVVDIRLQSVPFTARTSPTHVAH